MLGPGKSGSPALMGLTFNGFKGKHNVFLRDLGKVGDLENLPRFVLLSPDSRIISDPLL